jgi:hypothetical protein
MLKIIKQRECVEHEEFFLDFRHKATPSAGFGIPCDAGGVCIGNEYRSAEQDRAHAAQLRADPTIEFVGIGRHAWRYWEPAVAECVCGRKIHLDGDTDCACGRLFNTFGQELNPNWTYMDAIENGEGDPRFDDDY